MSRHEALSRVERLMEKAMSTHPHSKDILHALKPIITGRIRIAGTLKMKNADYLKIDKSRLKGGVPVIKQIALLTDDAPARDIALAIIPDMKQGLSAISEDLEKLEKQIRKGDMEIFDYLHAYPDNVKKVVDDWAARFTVKPSTIDFLCRTVARIILEKRSKDIADHLKDFDWQKGYCPICGAFPAISMIQEKGGQRWLHCSQCGYEWRFSRVICPYCEHEGQEGMTYFFVEDKDLESAFICEKCNKYLITLNKIGNMDDRDFEISAISLVHLDMIMQDKGFTPMTDCAWNAFL